MSEESTNTPSRWRRRTKALGLVAAGAAAGGVLAGTLSATAANTSGTPAPAYGAFGGGDRMGQMPMMSGNGGPGPGHFGGAAPVRGDERGLSGSDAQQVKAAALKAVPGGTVYRVETDAGDGVYEAHMTKSDGTPVTVKLDKDFKVTKVEDGMGVGDPGPTNQPGSSGPAA